MAIDHCPICGELDFWGKHRCPPKWKVFNAEYGGEDDFKTIFAASAEEAAEKYGEWYDQGGDYTLANGDILTVEVEPEMGGERKKLIVSAEPKIYYHADMV